MTSYLTLVILLQYVTSSDDVRFGVRKDVQYLTIDEKEEMLSTLYKMKIEPSRFNNTMSAWDYFPWIHAMSCTSDYPMISHETWAFLPWHRAFLNILEGEINFYMNRSDDNRFKLPYWNPTDNNSIDAVLWDTSFLGGNGDPQSDPPFLVPDEYALGGIDKFPMSNGFGILDVANVSYSYPSLARWIGDGTFDTRVGLMCGSKLDPKSVWDNLYNLETYDVYPYNMTHEDWNVSNCRESFRGQVEGCNPIDEQECRQTHSVLHRYIGGHVSDLFWSPNDPLFFMLHGWIDLMWTMWQDIHDKDFNNFPKEYLNESLFKGLFNNNPITANDVLDVRNQLFYIYDLQETDDSGGDDGFEWDWDAWYVWVGALIIFVFVSTCIIYCLCTWNDNQYQRFKSIGQDPTEYGATLVNVKT